MQTGFATNRKGGLDVRLELYRKPVPTIKSAVWVNTTRLHYNRYHPNNLFVCHANLVYHRLGSDCSY